MECLLFTCTSNTWSETSRLLFTHHCTLVMIDRLLYDLKSHSKRRIEQISRSNKSTTNSSIQCEQALWCSSCLSSSSRDHERSKVFIMKKLKQGIEQSIILDRAEESFYEVNKYFIIELHLHFIFMQLCTRTPLLLLPSQKSNCDTRNSRNFSTDPG